MIKNIYLPLVRPSYAPRIVPIPKPTPPPSILYTLSPGPAERKNPPPPSLSLWCFPLSILSSQATPPLSRPPHIFSPYTQNPPLSIAGDETAKLPPLDTIRHRQLGAELLADNLSLGRDLLLRCNQGSDDPQAETET